MAVPGLAGSSGGRRQPFLHLSENRIAYLLVLPTLLILIGLAVYPLGWTVATAFRSDNLFNPLAARWVGPRNFEFLFFNDDTFWKTLRLAGIWCAITVPVQLILGLFLAMLLDTTMRGIGILRTLIVIPVFITPVALGLSWRAMFEPIGGLLNYLLQGVGLEKSLWHTHPDTALLSVMIVDIWQWTPFVTLILLAGMQGISPEVVEAARLDRVRGLTYLRRIVLPQALRVIIPPLGNQFLNLAKNSSLAIAVSYTDIYQVTNTIINQSGQSVTGILMVLLSYLIISLVISLMMNLVNQRFQIVTR